MKSHLLMFIILGSTMLISCGNDSRTKSAMSSKPVENEINATHHDYRVVFSKLNPAGENHQSIGTASFEFIPKEDGDEGLGERLSISMALLNLPSSHEHIQLIHEGDRCPGPEDDVNQDGFVDYEEGQSAYGAKILSLDADLNSQEEAEAVFPSNSSYNYREETEVKNLPLVNFENKVIVIYGSGSSLPESVAAMGDKTREASLPVACGKIVQVVAE